jgi:hypothetical protein
MLIKLDSRSVFPRSKTLVADNAKRGIFNYMETDFACFFPHFSTLIDIIHEFTMNSKTAQNSVDLPFKELSIAHFIAFLQVNSQNN